MVLFLDFFLVLIIKLLTFSFMERLMKKSEVLGYFGGVVKTAAALGTSKTTVSMWGEEVPWKWALLIQAVTAGALKYELHIPTVVIPGSDHNPPSNQGGDS